MTIPMEYQHASQEFESFLRDVIDESGLVTRNQAYTMVQAVLLVFRRRLEIRDAIRFANVLPAVLRAIFVADWDVQEPLRQFASIAEMTEEVKAFRRHHNFSPDNAIKDVVVALRKNINQSDLDHVLASLPTGAADFWRIDQ
jgi:uncharacterized protein (DUF2267 family)